MKKILTVLLLTCTACIICANSAGDLYEMLIRGIRSGTNTLVDVNATQTFVDKNRIEFGTDQELSLDSICEGFATVAGVSFQPHFRDSFFFTVKNTLYERNSFHADLNVTGKLVYDLSVNPISALEIVYPDKIKLLHGFEMPVTIKLNFSFFDGCVNAGYDVTFGVNTPFSFTVSLDAKTSEMRVYPVLKAGFQSISEPVGFVKAGLGVDGRYTDISLTVSVI